MVLELELELELENGRKKAKIEIDLTQRSLSIFSDQELIKEMYDRNLLKNDDKKSLPSSESGGKTFSFGLR